MEYTLFIPPWKDPLAQQTKQGLVYLSLQTFVNIIISELGLSPIGSFVDSYTLKPSLWGILGLVMWHLAVRSRPPRRRLKMQTSGFKVHRGRFATGQPLLELW